MSRPYTQTWARDNGVTQRAVKPPTRYIATDVRRFTPDPGDAAQSAKGRVSANTMISLDVAQPDCRVHWPTSRAAASGAGRLSVDGAVEFWPSNIGRCFGPVLAVGSVMNEERRAHGRSHPCLVASNL